MILARLLTPYDFGILELLIVFSVISHAFVDSGFSQAIIRDKNASNTDLTSVFYLNLIIAAIIYIILFFCAPLIASFFKEPSLIVLSRVVFLTIIFDSFSIIQNANYTRNIDFKTPAIASTIAMLIAGAMAVYMAYNGYGVWSLVFNMIVYSFIKMILLWMMSKWRPNGGISTISLKKYFAFGGNLLAQGLVDKIVTNLESIMIGRYYTKSDLGFFSQGRKLDSYIVQTSTGVIQRVTYPVLSQLGDDKVKLKEGYRKVIQMTMLIMIPLMLGVVASANNLIVVVFGKQWIDTIPYLRLWAIVGLFLSLYSFFTNIFLVLGKSRQLLYLSLIRQFVRLVAVLIFVKISIMALMWSIVVVTFFSALMYIYFGGRQIDYSLKELLLDLWQIILAALVGAVTIYFIDFYSNIESVFLLFAIQLVAMGVICFSILKVFRNTYLIELGSIIKSFVSKV